jgi:hypothetical protein
MRRSRPGIGDHETGVHRVAPQCGRADCARPASARLMLDITNRIVTIDLAIGEVGAGMLCFAHAERIVVPRGWSLVDNRTVRPSLFDGERYEVALPAEPVPEVELAAPLVTSKRRERRKRNLLPGVGASDVPDRFTAEHERSGQFDLAGGGVDLEAAHGDVEVVIDVTADEEVGTGYGTGYDLPSPYRDASSAVEIDEPDRTSSPLLARAFEVTKTKRRP